MVQLFYVLSKVFEIYQWILIIRILMSWVPDIERTAIGQILVRITEPYLGIFRKFIPPFGMIDVSPIVAFFALYLIQKGLFTLLLGML